MTKKLTTTRILVRISLSTAAFLLLFLATSTTASAQDLPSPIPPSAVVVEVWNATEYGPNGGNPYGYWGVDMSINFRLSDNDPDQINGSFSYTLHRVNATDDPFQFLDYHLNFTPDPIPDRPGWAHVVQPVQQFTLAYGEERIWITAWNATSEIQSDPSCSVVVDIREDRRYYPESLFNPLEHTIWGWHDQCGTPVIGAPTGAVAVVTQSAGGGEATERQPVTELRWRLSADDPDNDTGNFTYYVLANPVDRGASVDLEHGVVIFPFTAAYEDPVTVADDAGIRFYASNVGTSRVPTINFTIRAADPNTRQWSNDSCTLVVVVSSVLHSPACGGLTSSGIEQGDPHFPLIDLPSTAEDMGLSVTALGLLLAGIFLLFTTLGGYHYAGGVGAMVGGAGGFGCVISMALVAPWLAVLVFLIALAVIAAHARSPGGTA